MGRQTSRARRPCTTSATAARLGARARPVVAATLELVTDGAEIDRPFHDAEVVSQEARVDRHREAHGALVFEDDVERFLARRVHYAAWLHDLLLLPLPLPLPLQPPRETIGVSLVAGGHRTRAPMDDRTGRGAFDSRRRWLTRAQCALSSSSASAKAFFSQSLGSRKVMQRVHHSDGAAARPDGAARRVRLCGASGFRPPHKRAQIVFFGKRTTVTRDVHATSALSQ